MENEKTLFSRLLDAKAEIKAVHKNAKNPHFKNNYADLNAILDEVEPILLKHGLVLTQPIVNGIQYTRITDPQTGEIIESELPLPTGVTPQQLGSAITYFRRYTLQSLLTLRTTDDDGNDANGGKTPETTPQAPKTAPIPDETMFNTMVVSVLEGKRTAEKILSNKNFTFTDEQIEILKHEQEIFNKGQK